jgi:hypothetical protein
MSVQRLALSTALSAAGVGIVKRLPGVEDVMAVRTAMLRYWEGLDKFLDVPFGGSFEPPGDGEHDAPTRRSVLDEQKLFSSATAGGRPRSRTAGSVLQVGDVSLQTGQGTGFHSRSRFKLRCRSRAGRTGSL